MVRLGSWRTCMVDRQARSFRAESKRELGAGADDCVSSNSTAPDRSPETLAAPAKEASRTSAVRRRSLVVRITRPRGAAVEAASLRGEDAVGDARVADGVKRDQFAVPVGEHVRALRRLALESVTRDAR